MANYKLNQTGEQIQNVLNLIDSNAATSGQVLTANGTGGASWQNASGGGGGGGTQLYRHQIEGKDSNEMPLSFSMIMTRSAPLLTMSDISITDIITCAYMQGVGQALLFFDGQLEVIYRGKVDFETALLTTIVSDTVTPL